MDEACNELNDRLLALVIAAQKPDLSPETRSRLIGELIKLVQKHLVRPHQARFPYGYEEIYEEARQNLFLFLCQNIHQYKPAKASVLAWLTFLLKTRFVIEASRKIIGKFPIQFGEIEIEHLSSRDSETVSLAELARKCLEEDSDQSFRQAHIENYPEANFRAIALWRLDDLDWKEIASETSIPVPTLSAFYQRQLKKFQLKMQTYIQDNSHLCRRDLDL